LYNENSGRNERERERKKREFWKGLGERMKKQRRRKE